MAPFIKRRWGHGVGGVSEKDRQRERGREGGDQLLHTGLTLFPFTHSVCHNTS